MVAALEGQEEAGLEASGNSQSTRPRTADACPHSMKSDFSHMKEQRLCRSAHGSRPRTAEDTASAKPEAHLNMKDSLEAENQLRQFLTVARPEWAMINRNGNFSMNKVLAKLKDIGVTDRDELMRRVRTNTINMDLSEAGHTRFGDDTVEALRKEGMFLRALGSLKEPHYRQTGCFAPVPLLLAKTYSQGWGGAKPSNASTSDARSRAQRPATATAGAWKLPRELDIVAAVPKQRASGAGQGSGRHRGVGGNPGSMRRSASAPQLRVKDGEAVPAEARPRLRYAGKGPAPSSVPAAASPARPHSAGASGAASNSAAPARNATPSLKQRGSPGPLHAYTITLPLHAGELGVASSGKSDCTSEDAERSEVEAEVERLHHMVMSMRSRPRIACWRPAAQVEADAAELTGHVAATVQEEARTDSQPAFHPPALERAADQVLKEKQALEEKEYMFLQMRREGSHSATRRVIAANVRSRLRKAAATDSKKVADVHQRCTRIRKGLQEMHASRRELRAVRRRAESLQVDSMTL